MYMWSKINGMSDLISINFAVSSTVYFSADFVSVVNGASIEKSEKYNL